MNGTYPMPQELDGSTSPSMYQGDKDDENAKRQHRQYMAHLKHQYGYDNWYDWRVRNWGTKWDVTDYYCSVKDATEFVCTFSTAWAPPVNWMQYVSKLYPKLVFRISYIEEGMQFCGVSDAINGQLTDTAGEIHHEDEDGRRVVWDSKKDRWKYEDDGTVIDDEDFYPNPVNSID